VRCPGQRPLLDQRRAAHVGGMVPHLAEALPFFEARVAGLPQIGSCWAI
jgi:hypothetical protein